MANRIQPHPNPAYLKSDGTLNVSGQIKLYASGTTTPKIAYKDAAGTSYGSTIDLNSSGLPTDGPIYWDTTALYKVEVYTRVDDTPTYALDYTVDSYGVYDSGSSGAPNEYAYTVDGIGSTDTTFITLTAAMEAARLVNINPTGLTITVLNGRYIDDSPNFDHPQGQYIFIIGESQAGVIFENTGGGAHFSMEAATIGRLANLTIEASSGFEGLTITKNSTLLDLNDVTFVASRMYVADNSFVSAQSLIFNGRGLVAVDNAVIKYRDIGATWTFNSSSTSPIYASSNSTIIADNVIQDATVGTCVDSNRMAYVTIDSLTTTNLAGAGVYIASFGGQIYSRGLTLDGTEGTVASPADNTIKSVTAGSADTALISLT